MKTKLLVLVVLWAFVSNCGALSEGGGKYPSSTTAEMKTDFNRAEADYKRNQFDSALQKYKSYLQKHPYNSLSDESRYKIGKIFFLQHNWDLVISEMKILAQVTPDPLYRAKALLLAAYAGQQAEKYETALGLLGQIKTQRLPSKLLVRYFSLKLIIGESLDQPRAELDQYVLQLKEIYDQSADPGLQSLENDDLFTSREVKTRLASFIARPISKDEIPSWMFSYPRGETKGYVEYKLGKIYVESGDPDRAAKHLQRFVSEYPKNEYVSSARQLLQNLGQGSGSVSNAKDRIPVGILLPLSGAQSSFGNATLQGVRCAAQENGACESLSSLASRFPNVRLIVKDSGTTPKEVENAMEDLAGEDVVAIVGPMSSSLAEAAAKKAERLKIVLFPMTQRAEVMAGRKFVFQMGYAIERQARDLANQARKKGFKNVGILAPTSPYGQELAKQFQGSAQSAGLKIVTKVFYPSGAELSSKVREIKTRTEAVKIDAIFIPDSFGALGRVMTTLRDEGISQVALLGTNAWNDPSVNQLDWSMFPGSFFVDLYNRNDSRGLSSSFSQAFGQSYQRAPSSVEALGFDALWLVREHAHVKIKSSALRDAISTMTSQEGVTGIEGFSEGARVSPSVIVLSAPSGTPN